MLDKAALSRMLSEIEAISAVQVGSKTREIELRTHCPGLLLLGPAAMTRRPRTWQHIPS